MPAPRLSDPEAEWQRRAPRKPLREEVERRLGPTGQPLTLLDGGRANTNIRIGTDRVLRIYERDPGAVAKERLLLSRGWTRFRVPRVLSSGDDFLLLEYVPHEPLPGDRAHGRAVGAALAEIHETSFPCAGFLGASLSVESPFGPQFETLRSYALSSLDGEAGELRTQVARFLERNERALSDELSSARLLHGDFKASNLRRLPGGGLLVLDWEFAYAGSPLLDIGQILRWRPPPDFVTGFSEAYVAGGGELRPGWRRWAAASDLFNLAGMLKGRENDPTRLRDIRRRIIETLETSREQPAS